MPFSVVVAAGSKWCAWAVSATLSADAVTMWADTASNLNPSGEDKYENEDKKELRN